MEPSRPTRRRSKRQSEQPRDNASLKKKKQQPKFCSNSECPLAGVEVFKLWKGGLCRKCRSDSSSAPNSVPVARKNFECAVHGSACDGGKKVALYQGPENCGDAQRKIFIEEALRLYKCVYKKDLVYSKELTICNAVKKLYHNRVNCLAADLKVAIDNVRTGRTQEFLVSKPRRTDGMVISKLMRDGRHCFICNRYQMNQDEQEFMTPGVAKTESRPWYFLGNLLDQRGSMMSEAEKLFYRPIEMKQGVDGESSMKCWVCPECMDDDKEVSRQYIDASLRCTPKASTRHRWKRARLRLQQYILDTVVVERRAITFADAMDRLEFYAYDEGEPFTRIKPWDEKLRLYKFYHCGVFEIYPVQSSSSGLHTKKGVVILPRALETSETVPDSIYLKEIIVKTLCNPSEALQFREKAMNARRLKAMSDDELSQYEEETNKLATHVARRLKHFVRFRATQKRNKATQSRKEDDEKDRVKKEWDLNSSINEDLSALSPIVSFARELCHMRVLRDCALLPVFFSYLVMNMANHRFVTTPLHRIITMFVRCRSFSAMFRMLHKFRIAPSKSTFFKDIIPLRKPELAISITKDRVQDKVTMTIADNVEQTVTSRKPGSDSALFARNLNASIVEFVDVSNEFIDEVRTIRRDTESLNHELKLELQTIEDVMFQMTKPGASDFDEASRDRLHELAQKASKHTDRSRFKSKRRDISQPSTRDFAAHPTNDDCGKGFQLGTFMPMVDSHDGTPKKPVTTIQQLCKFTEPFNKKMFEARKFTVPRTLLTASVAGGDKLPKIRDIKSGIEKYFGVKVPPVVIQHPIPAVIGPGG